MYLNRILRFVVIFVFLNVGESKRVLDPDLYNTFLNPDVCSEQMRFVKRNGNLLSSFLDAGLRVPKGIRDGNFVDLGNYHQCVGIHEEITNSTIDGKYCMLNIPMRQILKFPSIFPRYFDPSALEISEHVLQTIQKYQSLQQVTGLMKKTDHFRSDDNSFVLTFQLAMCLPKTCTTQEAIEELLVLTNVSAIGFEYGETFCRISGDKPFTTGDYVAIAIFFIIGVLTILSTSYDVYRTVYFNKDPNTANTIYQSFSAYNNARRLITFNRKPGNLDCMDGIRSIAMIWVIVGHAVTNVRFFHLNVVEFYEWVVSLRAIWITAAPITVDTFFMMGGVLLVYTMAAKTKANTFLKSIPIFYLTRLLRMFPLLACIVLLQATLFNHISDGPSYAFEAAQVNICRENWWATLLHVQNYIHPEEMCIPHSWYIAVDVQLYIISPIILYWVLTGNRRYAWSALILGVLGSLAASTTYNIIMNFPGWNVTLARLEDFLTYTTTYYYSTLTRAPGFFVGMTVGYILHTKHGQKVNLPKPLVALLWLVWACIPTVVLYFPYVTMQADYENRLLDNFMNSFLRPTWAIGLGWLVFACVHGYGGPINWFLSLNMWQLPARLSYAMYLFHYPIMYLMTASESNILYYSVPRLTFDFLSHFAMAMLVGFAAIVLIEAPFSILFTMMIKSLQDLMAPPKVKPKTYESVVKPIKDNISNINCILKQY